MYLYQSEFCTSVKKTTGHVLEKTKVANLKSNKQKSKSSNKIEICTSVKRKYVLLLKYLQFIQ